MEPTQTPQPAQSSKNNILLPISIIVAGLLIAGSIFVVNQKNLGGIDATVKNTSEANPEENMRPIDATDHILGSPSAPVVIVEYSDTECPFCQAFHPTLKRIVDKYGKDGKVAWVYRHFPLTSIHPRSAKEAEATECAAELGGNSKFWEYLDLLFSKKNFKQQPYTGVETSELPTLATSIGLDKTSFSACLNSGKHANKISASYEDALNASQKDRVGTPYTILVTKGLKVPITSGAVPFDQLDQAIQALLNENPN